MNRTLIMFAILFFILIMIIPLGTRAFNQENYKTISTQNITKEKNVGNLSEANVALYATEREGYLEKFRLNINGGIKHFPLWINVSNETYWPQLFYRDINHDGIKELIIVLTTGYGTGVIEQNVHVFQRTKTNVGEIYSEVIVDNPVAILLKNVETKLTKSEAIINIGNERTVIKIDKLDVDPKNLFTDIYTENLVRFDVLDNELTAIMGAQISPVGGYIGDFYITYEFKDKMYQVKRIRFIPLAKS